MRSERKCALYIGEFYCGCVLFLAAHTRRNDVGRQRVVCIACQRCGEHRPCSGWLSSRWVSMLCVCEVVVVDV